MKALLVFVGLVAAVSAGTWQLKTPHFAPLAEALGCVSATTCVAPVGVNGQGSFIWSTTDGGNTWTTDQEPFELMFLGAAAQGQSSVVADELSLLYSNEPGTYSFAQASGDALVTSQNVEAFASTYYGAAGGDVVNNANGASVSADSGVSWTFHNVSELQTMARYGAYPSVATWFISAGEWPDNHNPATPETYHRLTSRIHINQEDKTVMSTKFFPRNEEEPTTPGWKAQIVKSTDGGVSWSSVFYDEGNFYFNQISCSSATHCCAVGEADTSDQPGIRFYCTWDGGSTWDRTHYDTNPDMSVLAMQFIDDNNGWAGGGDMNPLGFVGYFWQTTDGGKTWTNQTVPGQYINDFAFPTADNGFAVAFSEEGDSSLCVYS